MKERSVIYKRSTWEVFQVGSFLRRRDPRPPFFVQQSSDSKPFSVFSAFLMGVCSSLHSFSLHLLFSQPSFRCRNCICHMTHHSFAGTSLIKINCDLISFVVDFPYFLVSCHSVSMCEERMKERSSQDSPESLINSTDSEQRTWLLQRANSFLYLFYSMKSTHNQ